jgi:hypothetical protein
MATYTPSIGARSALTVTGLGTLASATYVVSAAMDHDTAKEPTRFIEVTVATTNTPAGNKQVVVMAKASLDGTNWTSGPESGTTATDEPDLYLVGVVPMNTASTTHRRVFDLGGAFGGRLPKQTKLVIKNDLGVALTSGEVYTAVTVDTIT